LASIILKVFIDFHNFKKKSTTYAEAYKHCHFVPSVIWAFFVVWLVSGKQQQTFLLLVNPQKAQNSKQSTQLGYFFFAFSPLKSIQHF